MKRIGRALLLLMAAGAAALAAGAASASPALWAERAVPNAAPLRACAAHLVRSRTFQLDSGALRATLARAGAGGIEFALPLPDGRLVRMRATKSPVLGEDVQRALPEFHSFVARGIDDRSITARLDVSRLGFRAMLLTPDGTAYLEPFLAGRDDYEVGFWARDDASNAADFTCTTQAPAVAATRTSVQSRAARTAPTLATEPHRPSTSLYTSGDTLRTFRFVVLADGTFTTHLAGGDTLVAMSEMATAVNRLNAIYERDLSIHLTAVWLKAYPDSATDPWRTLPPDPVSGTINSQLADSLIGQANYDCGIRLGYVPLGYTGGTAVGCVCRDDYDQKAEGNMLGGALNDEYYRIIMHETAHEFGTTHTQDAPCQRYERPYEPGSGSTIMARANRCAPYNIQDYDDHYFHAWSIADIGDFLKQSGDCSSQTATGNHPPTAEAGTNYTIPRGTPFALTGVGTDADADDALTYCWEEYDWSPTSFDAVNGPLLRSRIPSPSPTRWFPPVDSVLAHSTYAWEKLATVNRTMKFMLTVRDNHPGCGGQARDSMVVTVNGNPFAITSPNGGGTLHAGVAFPVNWTVGGGSVAASVNILLSTDGGQTWTPLATNTPNDGSENVTALLATTFTTCRIKVEAVGNIFYDVSDANFTVIGDPTETLVSLLSAEVSGDGVTLRWSVARQFARIAVDRAVDAEGPWTTVAEALDATLGTFLDRDAPSAATSFYRLRASTADGSVTTFGPIAATLAPAIARLAISSIAPNPATDRWSVEYAVPRAAHVRLSLLDLQGRQVASLVDRTVGPGRYQTTWSTAGARAPGPGVYFLRLEGEAAHDTRRLVIRR